MNETIGNFLDLEGLCGEFWLQAWWISGRLQTCHYHKGICQEKSKSNQAIWLLNNKFLSGGHHSLLLDQGFPNNGQLQRHLANPNTI